MAGGLGRIKGGEGRAFQAGPLGETVRAKVGDLMAVAVDPGEGGLERVQGGRPVYILRGDGVDRRHTRKP